MTYGSGIRSLGDEENSCGDFKQSSPIAGRGDRRIYLNLLIRVACWQSQLYPDTHMCGIWLESAVCQSNRLTSNNNNTPTDAVSTTVVDQLVTFHDDKVPNVNSIPLKRTPDPELLRSLKESRDHTIKDILSRPCEIFSGLWTTVQTVNTVITSFAFPSAFLNLVNNKAKIKGFAGFRGTLVVRLQINAQRFQQGRLILHALPYPAGAGPNRITVANSSIIFKTQQPRIDFDANTDTDVQLRLPFVYPFEYYGLTPTASTAQVYNVYLSVYSALVSPTGVTNAPITMYAHYEDVELEYPTYNAQVYEAQAGGSSGRRRSPGDAELGSTGAGPISALLGKVSSAATIMGEIPLLSSFTAPLAWVTSVTSRAAAAMGFSNPSTSAPVGKMIMDKFAYSNNSNAVDNSRKMGLFADNQVAILPGFAGTDVDELSLRHLTSIPSYTARANWQDITATGTAIFQQSICPSAFSGVSLMSNGTVNIAVDYPSPVAYFSNLFTYWRGSFCLTFKFVKTEFHSGRLMVVWYPGNTVTPVMADADFAYREILDLRISNEFTVCIPYASVYPWMRVNEPTGVVAVYVLNPLRAPSTVSDYIQVLLEVSAGPDFELARPCDPPKLPAMVLGGVPPAFADNSDFEEIFEAQGASGENIVSCSADAVSGIPTSSISGEMDAGYLAASKYCMGEHIISARQLLLRSTPWYQNEAGGVLEVAFRPWALYIPLFNVGSPIIQNASLGIDYVSYIGSTFAFSRGGMRLKAYTKIDGQRIRGNLREDPAFDYFLASALTTTWTGPIDMVLQRVLQTGGIELEIPQYTRVHMRSNPVFGGAVPVAVTPATDSNLIWFGTDSVDPSWRILRQFSEDSALGFFYGCLPLIPAENCASHIVD